MALLSYIADKDLEKIVSDILTHSQPSETDKQFAKNAIDPFAALFEMSIFSLKDIGAWKKAEQQRQQQKTLQNKVGLFHQKILGALRGWEDLKTGKLVDICCHDKKIVAEVKNKHNTTKGSDKVVIYDNLDKVLVSDYVGYTGYYVEIIPKSPKRYNEPFAPPDNKTKANRLLNERIRVIDGVSFYALATGVNNALEQLFDALPAVIYRLSKQNIPDIPAIKNYYRQTFG